MFRKHDRRAPRRTTVPTLATLEDRRLMTGGLAPTVAAAPMTLQAYAEDSALPAHDAEPRTLQAYAEDSALPAHDAESSKDWISIGSDALFGPEGLHVLSYGNAWPMPATPSGMSADPSTPQGKLDAAFAKQSADIQAIQDRSEVTPRLLAGLPLAREKAASEAGAVDPALVQKLQEGVDAARVSGAFSDAQQAQIQADLTAALKSAGVSDATIAGLFAAQDAVRTASHVTADDLKTLAENQAAIQSLLDAMPSDAVAYRGEIAAMARGAGVAATGSAATGSAATGSTVKSLAGVGNRPTAARPSGFDPSAQLSRLSRRVANTAPGRIRAAVGNVETNTRRFVQNVQTVPSAITRKLPNFRGMRTSTPTTRP